MKKLLVGWSEVSITPEDKRISLAGQFFENLEHVLGERELDYLIVNHMEPDHSSLTAYLLEKYPDLKVVANAKTLPMLKGYYNTPEDRIMIMGEGQTLSLGSSTLRFHMVPMVHWPETMVTYLEEEHTLFSGDAFGTFGNVDENVIDDEETFEEYRDEMIRYYSNIVGKYGAPVQAALKKLEGLRIDRICSTHGPVWEVNVDQVVALYDQLSRYEVGRGVCIVYASMYGNTAAAADALCHAPGHRRLVLVWAGISAVASLLVTFVSFVLDNEIQGTGGLDGIGHGHDRDGGEIGGGAVRCHEFSHGAVACIVGDFGIPDVDADPFRGHGAAASGLTDAQDHIRLQFNDLLRISIVLAAAAAFAAGGTILQFLMVDPAVVTQNTDITGITIFHADHHIGNLQISRNTGSTGAQTYNGIHFVGNLNLTASAIGNDSRAVLSWHRASLGRYLFRGRSRCCRRFLGVTGSAADQNCQRQQHYDDIFHFHIFFCYYLLLMFSFFFANYFRDPSLRSG